MSKKLEDKQRRRQLQEQRDKERRKEARRRNMLTWGVVVVVAALVVGLIYLERQKESGPVGVAAEEAGCTAIQPVEEMPSASHVDEGTDVQYSTSPPTSGDHYAQPAQAGFFPPSTAEEESEERFVHNLEHGQIVIWYRPDAPSSVIDGIETYIDNTKTPIGVLGVPYPTLDDSTSLVLTAWGAHQSCADVSSEVINEFRSRFQGRGPEQVGIPTFTS